MLNQKNSFSSGAWAAAEILVGGEGKPKKGTSPHKGPPQEKRLHKGPHMSKRAHHKEKKAKIVHFLNYYFPGGGQRPTLAPPPPPPALMLRCLTFKNVVRTRFNWKTKSMLLQIFIMAKMIAIML